MKMAMKVAMLRMKKRVTKVGSRAQVWHGTKAKTRGGLTRADLKKNKAGKLVGRKASAAGLHSAGYRKIREWANAVHKARRSIGAKGFVPVGGRTAQGHALYKAAQSFLK